MKLLSPLLFRHSDPRGLRYLLLSVSLFVLAAGCGRDKTVAAPEGAEAPPTSTKTTGEEVAPKTAATPELDPRAAPRPPEPPLLQDGAYTGEVAAQPPGTLSFTISEGKITEASANLNGGSFVLTGQVSGHKVSLGGKEGDDFVRFMGKGTDSSLTGSWMGNLSGQRLQGSWTAKR